MEAGDGFFEAVAANEAHGIKRAAVGILAEAIHGDDAGMLESAGDLGFEDEAGAAFGVVGAIEFDFLERDLAVQLLVLGHEDLTEAAFGMRSENAESRLADRGGVERKRGVWIFLAGLAINRDMQQARFHLRVTELFQVVAK